MPKPIKKFRSGSDNLVERLDHRYYYLLTIRKCRVKEKVTEKQLRDILWVESTLRDYRVINSHVENDGAYNQLHLHVILVTEGRYIRYQSVHNIAGFHIHYQLLPERSDVHKAQIYVSKGQYDKLSK